MRNTTNNAGTVQDITHSAALTTPAFDYTPSKLLCNHAFIAARIDTNYRAVRGKLNRHDGSPLRSEQLLFVRLTTPRGGCEHRPLSRFDVLPANYTDHLYTLRPNVAKPTFDRVILAADVGPTQTEQSDTYHTLASDLASAVAVLTALTAPPAAPPVPAPATSPACLETGGPDPVFDSLPTIVTAPDVAPAGWDSLATPDVAPIGWDSVPSGLDIEPEPAADVAPSDDDHGPDDGTRYKLSIVTKNGRAKKRYLELIGTEPRPATIYRRVGSGRATRYIVAN